MVENKANEQDFCLLQLSQLSVDVDQDFVDRHLVIHKDAAGHISNVEIAGFVNGEDGKVYSSGKFIEADKTVVRFCGADLVVKLSHTEEAFSKVTADEPVYKIDVFHVNQSMRQICSLRLTPSQCE